eukprot:m.130481 g.130481  ORF g.130481 m.130481 type:complete len:140 (-) comp16790_c0_seq1:78-497(-)
MQHVTLEASGAQLSFATSWDPAHPPENCLDEDPSTFWASTGLFPQELIITFPQPTTISSLRTKTNSVKKLTVMKTLNKKPAGFEQYVSLDFDDSEDQVQDVTHKVGASVVRYLKIVIESGHKDFVAVYTVSCQGEAAMR